MLAQLLQDHEPDVAVQQHEAALGVRLRKDHQRLDQAEFADRCLDALVLGGLANAVIEQPHRQDLGERDLDDFGLTGQSHWVAHGASPSS